jgi:hypothetical protein
LLSAAWSSGGVDESVVILKMKKNDEGVYKKEKQKKYQRPK